MGLDSGWVTGTGAAWLSNTTTSTDFSSQGVVYITNTGNEPVVLHSMRLSELSNRFSHDLENLK